MRTLKWIVVVWKVVAWLFHRIVGLFNWAVNKLPGLRDGIAKWTQTFLFYAALGAMVLVVCMLPLPLWGKAIATLGFALLLSFTTVVRTRAGISEKDIRTLHEEKNSLETRLRTQGLQLQKIETDRQNERMRFFSMDWIMELNLAKIERSEIKMLDYFIRGSDAPIAWADRPAEHKAGDTRAIGALIVDYTAKIGLDLRQVLASVDASIQRIDYYIPDPSQTGVENINCRWPMQARIIYKKGKFGDFRDDWRWVEDSNHSTLPLWGQECAAKVNEVSAPKALHDPMGLAIRAEAERRLKSMFKALGYDSRPVPKEQLTAPDTLGQLLPSLVARQIPILISEQNDGPTKPRTLPLACNGPTEGEG
jgi:hypothetical protein